VDEAGRRSVRLGQSHLFLSLQRAPGAMVTKFLKTLGDLRIDVTTSASALRETFSMVRHHLVLDFSSHSRLHRCTSEVRKTAASAACNPI